MEKHRDEQSTVSDLPDLDVELVFLLPRGRAVHRYSHNPIKTALVDPLVDRLLDALLPAVRRYLDRTGGPRPDVFIFGHTHVPGRARLGGTEVWNTGGWVASLRRPEPAGEIGLVESPQGSPLV